MTDKKVVKSLDNGNQIIEDMELLNKYKFIGTVEECRQERMTGFELNEAKAELEFVKDRFYDFPEETNVSNSIKNIQNAIRAIEEIEDYYAIGTVEECRQARERQKAKKPTLYGDFEDGKLICQNCEEDLMDLAECGFSCCPYCGQKLDWSE